MNALRHEMAKRGWLLILPIAASAVALVLASNTVVTGYSVMYLLAVRFTA